MSLINDALKKAQRQRTGGAPETTPVPGGGSRPPVEAQQRANRAPQLTLLASGALLGVALAVGAVWLLRSDPPAPARAVAATPVAPAPLSSAPAPAQVTASDKTASTPVASTPPVPAPATSRDSAPQDKSIATPKPVVAPLANLAVGPGNTAPDSPAPAKAEPVPVKLPPTPKLAELVDAFRVAGIRAAGADSKVLINDRVYRIGDTVDFAHSIRLTGVAPTSLTFTDASGASYTRNL